MRMRLRAAVLNLAPKRSLNVVRGDRYITVDMVRKMQVRLEKETGSLHNKLL